MALTSRPARAVHPHAAVHRKALVTMGAGILSLAMVTAMIISGSVATLWPVTAVAVLLFLVFLTLTARPVKSSAPPKRRAESARGPAREKRAPKGRAPKAAKTPKTPKPSSAAAPVKAPKLSRAEKKHAAKAKELDIDLDALMPGVSDLFPDLPDLFARTPEPSQGAAVRSRLLDGADDSWVEPDSRVTDTPEVEAASPLEPQGAVQSEVRRDLERALERDLRRALHREQDDPTDVAAQNAEIGALKLHISILEDALEEIHLEPAPLAGRHLGADTTEPSAPAEPVVVPAEPGRDIERMLVTLTALRSELGGDPVAVQVLNRVEAAIARLSPQSANDRPVLPRPVEAVAPVEAAVVTQPVDVQPPAEPLVAEPVIDSESIQLVAAGPEVVLPVPAPAEVAPAPRKRGWSLSSHSR